MQVLGGFRLTLTVTSTYGTQTASTYVDVRTGTCGGGCPFVFVNSDSGYTIDNNILHKSEFDENQGKTITDLYKLGVQPKLDGNVYKLILRELNDDHSYFDAFKLYAVDHPEGTDIGVTENNDLIMFYPSLIVAPASATIYDQSLTDYIRHNAYGISGIKSDKLNFTFSDQSTTWRTLGNMKSSSSKDSVALVMKLGGRHDDVSTNQANQPKQEFAEVASDNRSLRLSGHESEAQTILPLSGDVLPQNLSILWNRAYNMKDVAVTRVFYSGFTKKELSFTQAVHSGSGDMLKKLSSADGQFGELASGETLTLVFKQGAALKQGWVRDFVLETKGYYLVPKLEGLSRTNKIESESQEQMLPSKFELIGNFPNPFNPATTISFDLARESGVQLTVYNSLGQRVRALLDETRSQGRYSITWDGKNDRGLQVPSGIYIYQLKAGDLVQSKKCLLIK